MYTDRKCLNSIIILLQQIILDKQIPEVFNFVLLLIPLLPKHTKDSIKITGFAMTFCSNSLTMGMTTQPITNATALCSVMKILTVCCSGLCNNATYLPAKVFCLEVDTVKRV